MLGSSNIGPNDVTSEGQRFPARPLVRIVVISAVVSGPIGWATVGVLNWLKVWDDVAEIVIFGVTVPSSLAPTFLAFLLYRTVILNAVPSFFLGGIVVSVVTGICYAILPFVLTHEQTPFDAEYCIDFSLRGSLLGGLPYGGWSATVFWLIARC